MPKRGVVTTLCFVFVLCCATITAPAQTLTKLHDFAGHPSDGGLPYAAVVQGSDGNFYGTSYYGGSTNHGTVFKMTSSGSVTLLHSFAGYPSDGGNPTGRLIQARDGNFYGTTNGGNGGGIIFKITPSGTLTTLHTFEPGQGDGGYPYAGLIQARDGNFYGTTQAGGTRSNGTVFKMTPSGTVTLLHSFACSDGCNPFGGLVQASDGSFYGTTRDGGTNGNNCGTVFKITSGGTFTLLHVFEGTDGCEPYDSLIQASDGNFYGTASGSGAHSAGTVFKMTPSGTLTTLYNFCPGGTPCVDGQEPYGPLLQGSDGNFNGTTFVGGSADAGTIFQITPAGTLTTLHSFESTDGARPEDGLIRANDGNFYGTTSTGGSSGDGTVFKLALTYETLTVSTTGNGSVTSTDGFINCPGTCTHNYLQNAQVTLNATPASGWAFSGWGGACSGTGSCSVTMSQNQNVSASFYQLPVTLTVSVVGSGSVTSTDGFIHCPGTCTHTYDPGTPVTLNAAAASGWIFAGWTGACTGVGACNLTMTDNFSVTGVFLEPGHGLAFNPVTPCRLVDTRTQNGGGGPIQGGTFQSFNLPQLAQSKGCADLSTAASYSLNVTVVPQGPLGYITIWPTGEAQPTISTMNSLDGRIKANAAIVPAGTNDSVSVYVSNTTDVVLDIDGYFAATTGSLSGGGSSLQFYPLTPCRVLDTRNTGGPLGGPYLKSGVERDFPVLSSDCNIPSTAQAYSMNFTVVPYEGQPLGYLTVWPEGGTRPVVSTLNNLTATIVANAAIVPAGTDGGIATYPSGNTQLVADIDGYFAPAGTGGLSLYPTAPCRVIDTRHGSGQFSGELTVNVVGSPCAPPSNAQAYVFNATVVPNGELGYLTLWPDTEQRPTASTLNAPDGMITSNMAIVPNVDGKTDTYASGTTQLILDISSFFAP